MNLWLSLLLFAAPVPGEVATANLYDLDVALVDHTGKSVKLDTFRGHPVVISMFYGTCTTACPLLVAKLQGLEAKLSAKARADTRVLLVSFDPNRDTPETLKKLAGSFGVDGRWMLARTSAESVRELAAALGIRYRFLSNGMLNHSSVLTVLDAAGNISTRIEGLDAPAAALVTTIEALSRDLPP